MFDGSHETFERLKRSDTAVVVPITDRGEIMLIEEEQPGRPPFVTFPGGRKTTLKEDPLLAAQREFLEETGYTSGDWTLWNAVQPTSKIDWAIYTFVAKGCRKIGEQKLDKGEKISLKLVSFEEFMDLASKDSFGNPDIMIKVLRAKGDPKEMAELKKMFSL